MDAEKLKMFLSFARLLEVIPPENIGEGVQAALRYYWTDPHETPDEDEDFDELSYAVYHVLIECLPEVIICQNME